jgi:hypothetical protein
MFSYSTFVACVLKDCIFRLTRIGSWPPRPRTVSLAATYKLSSCRFGSKTVKFSSKSLKDNRRNTNIRGLRLLINIHVIRILIGDHQSSRFKTMATPYKLGPAVVCSTAGILANFAFFCMNTTINYIAMPALLLGHPSHASSQTASKKPSPSTVSLLNRQWQEIYFRGHRVGPGLAVGAGLAHASAAYLAEVTNTKWFFGAAAASSIAIVPFTLVFMLATNDELHRRACSSKDADVSKTLGLLAEWVDVNKTRADIALLSACFGAVGVFMFFRG